MITDSKPHEQNPQQSIIRTVCRRVEQRLWGGLARLGCREHPVVRLDEQLACLPQRGGDLWAQALSLSNQPSGIFCISARINLYFPFILSCRKCVLFRQLQVSKRGTPALRPLPWQQARKP